MFVHFLSKLLVWCFFISQNFGSAKCFVGQLVYYIWISQICASVWFVLTTFFFNFPNPSRWGGGGGTLNVYYEQVLRQHTLHYYELKEFFWFLLILFFHLGGMRITCFVPGCSPHPGTSRLKVQKEVESVAQFFENWRY